MSTTKVKKKVFKPSQVDVLVFKVQDLGEMVMELTEEMEHMSDDIERLQRQINELSLVGNYTYINSSPTGAYATTTHTQYVEPTIKPWWKRWFGN